MQQTSVHALSFFQTNNDLIDQIRWRQLHPLATDLCVATSKGNVPTIPLSRCTRVQRFHARFLSTAVNFVNFLRHMLECIRTDFDLCLRPSENSIRRRQNEIAYECVMCKIANYFKWISRYIFALYMCVINRIVSRNASAKYANCVLNWMPNRFSCESIEWTRSCVNRFVCVFVCVAIDIVAKAK